MKFAIAFFITLAMLLCSNSVLASTIISTEENREKVDILFSTDYEINDLGYFSLNGYSGGETHRNENTYVDAFGKYVNESTCDSGYLFIYIYLSVF